MRSNDTMRAAVLAGPGRAAVEWAARLAAGERYSPAAEGLVDVARALDRIYGRPP